MFNFDWVYKRRQDHPPLLFKWVALEPQGGSIDPEQINVSR